MEKIAFVCQRYGLEVNGGSELYCRQTAEQLAARYDVTVYTTCALDYMTWKNHYPAGEEMINGVKVKRFPVDQERVQERFDRISLKVLTDPTHTDAEEEEWVREQGPYAPAVIRELEQEYTEYRVVFFMTYLYYLTAAGIGKIPNGAMIPTTHDEPTVYLRHYDGVFRAAKGLLWLTPEEAEFAKKRFPFIERTPQVQLGAGIEGPKGALPEIPAELKGEKYLVYAGRIDENKGCGEMFDFFRRYKRRYGGKMKLVLMGKAVMPVPEDPDIISLGFVSEEMKFAVMKEAFALVLASRFESLSMVVLESMLMGRPVLVSGHCAVLKGHAVRSGAGLYFDDFSDFAGCIRWLERHPEAYQAMRGNGMKYVKENYSWDAITGRFAELIGRIG